MARILHIFPAWTGTAAARRALNVARGLDTSIRHDVAVMEGMGSRRPPRSPFRLLREFPKVGGVPALGKLQKIAKAMIGYDLVCTYGYGAINAAMAHTAFSEAFTLPALIHHEDEAAKRGRRADFYRRVALGKSAGLAVPDERIEEAALVAWQQPMGRVKLIAEGIDLKPWRKAPPADMLRSVVKRPGEKWVGVVNALDCPKTSAAILHAFAPLTENWQLVVFGEDCTSLREMAEAMEVGHRVHTPGEIGGDARAIGLLDIILLPAHRDEGELDAIRAMAGGAVVIADPASRGAPLLPDNAQEFLVPLANQEELEFALGTLAADEGLRESLRSAGHEQAKNVHDEKAMIAVYKRLYSSAMELAR